MYGDESLNAEEMDINKECEADHDIDMKRATFQHVQCVSGWEGLTHSLAGLWDFHRGPGAR